MRPPLFSPLCFLSSRGLSSLGRLSTCSAVPLVLGLLLLALGAQPLQAGVVYEIEVTDATTSEPTTYRQEVVAEGKNIKMTVNDGGRRDGRVLFRGDPGQILILDDRNQTFSTFDRAMVSGMKTQVGSALEQARKALENVPEEQREMLKGLLEANMPTESRPRPNIVFETTEITGSHLGLPTRQVVVRVDGNKRHELWITPWGNVDQGEEDIEDTFLELSSFFREVLDAVGEMNGGKTPEITGMDSSFLGYMDQLTGFPVITRSFADDGSLEGESTLRSVQRMVLSPDAFEPPKGYRLRPIQLE